MCALREEGSVCPVVAVMEDCDKDGEITKNGNIFKAISWPWGRVWLEIGQGLQVHIVIFECHQI